MPVVQGIYLRADNISGGRIGAKRRGAGSGGKVRARDSGGLADRRQGGGVSGGSGLADRRRSGGMPGGGGLADREGRRRGAGRRRGVRDHERKVPWDRASLSVCCDPSLFPVKFATMGLVSPFGWRRIRWSKINRNPRRRKRSWR